MKKFAALPLCVCMALPLAGCGTDRQKDAYTPGPGLDAGKEAARTISIPYKTNKALNTAANAFVGRYPNVGVRLQYVEDLNPGANGDIQDQTGEDGAQFLFLGNGETKIAPEYVGRSDAARPGYAFCTLEYCLNGLERNFAKYRAG